MFFVAWVNLIIKVFIRGLNAEQVTVRARLKPTTVGLLGLLAERQCDAQTSVVYLLDFLH